MKWDLRVPPAALFHSSWHSEIGPRTASLFTAGEVIQENEGQFLPSLGDTGPSIVFATQGILMLRVEQHQFQQGKSAEMNETKGLQLLPWWLISSRDTESSTSVSSLPDYCHRKAEHEENLQ